MLRNPTAFSSAGGSSVGSLRPLLPTELEPAEHSVWREALDPLFAPVQVNGLEKTIAALADELIDEFVGEDEIDFTARFSVPFPARVLMMFLGLPHDDLARLLDMTEGVLRPHRALGKSLQDPEVARYRAAMSAEVYAYFDAALDQRRLDPADDLLSRLLSITIDGRPITTEDLLDVCFTLLVEGIKPVSAALDCAFTVLAERPHLRHKVKGGSRRALEELLRWATPVKYLARTATTHLQLGGCPIAGGQRVVALLDAANIDPVDYDDAGELRVDRVVNPHLAFGLGPHRCLGSHLARLQILVALRVWHDRIPDYSIRPLSQPEMTCGVRTFDQLPMRLGKSLCE